jgi:predicted Zn-dependent protease
MIVGAAGDTRGAGRGKRGGRNGAKNCRRSDPRAANRQRAGFALNSGRSLLAEGKLDEAVVQLLMAAQAEPTLAEPHRMLAEAYTRQGKAASLAAGETAGHPNSPQ